MNYLLISNLALLIFFLIYRFGLKNLTFFSLNRWYLLSSVLIAYLMPLVLFVNFRVPQAMQITLPAVELTLQKEHTSELLAKTIETNWQPSMMAIDWLTLSYWLGVMVTLCVLSYRVITLLKGRPSVRQHGSYSFFRRINLAEAQSENKIIQQHEQVHVRQGHSYDILLIEVIRVFNWFNPILSWIRDEMKFQHECIVDDHFSENKVAYAELLVAHALSVQPHQLSHEFSNKSQLTERIKMIFKDKSKSKNRLFYLSILPVAIMLFGLTINCKSPNKENTSSTSEDTTLARSSQKNAQLETDTPVDTVKFPEPEVSPVKTDENVKFPEPKIEKIENEPTAAAVGTFGVFSYDKIEEKPQYPGGIDQFRREVAQKIIYPQAAIDAGVKGTIELTFVINKEGKIEDIKVAKDIGHGAGAASVAALKGTKTWKPGKYKGLDAKVSYLLPIRMDLSPM